MPNTLVVIPHYGSDQLIHDLFRSIGHTFPENSFSGRLTLLERPGYSFLIVNDNNTRAGFTAACNEGLKQLMAPVAAYEFAWLLNNDTLFESFRQFEHSLHVMQTLARTNDWAIVAQQVRHFERRDDIIFGGAWECFPAGRHKSGLCSRGDWELPSEENWLSFCSVLVRSDLVARIGPMDEAFNNYFSDSDYSLEARQAGFRIGYSGKDSFVFHRVGQSANPSGSQQHVLHNDYMAFWKKWIGASRHADYLRLMPHRPVRPGSSKPPQLFAAGGLAAAALNYAELRSWLMKIPENQMLHIGDILDHFQHQQPVTPFSALCNITRELLEAD